MELKTFRWNEDLSVISMDGDLEKFNLEKNHLLVTHACGFKEELFNKLPDLEGETLESWKNLRESFLSFIQPRRDSRYYKLNNPKYLSVIQVPEDGLDMFTLGIDTNVPSEYLTILEKIPHLDENPLFSLSSCDEYEDMYYTIIRNLIPLQ